MAPAHFPKNISLESKYFATPHFWNVLCPGF